MSSLKANKGVTNRNSMNLKPVAGNNGIPTLSLSNPFDSRVEQGYDKYLNSVGRSDFKK